MTSPYANQGYADSSALATMYEQQGKFNQQELDQRYKISKDDISARLKIASQQSKDNRYGVDAQRDAEREKLALAREDMEKIGIPKMLIDKYVAEKNYEIAQAEMTLKRDMFVEETAQARAKLQLDREQMEKIGIPQVEINRYVAEQNARIQQAQQTGYFNGAATLDRQKFASDAEYQRAQLAQSAREFQTTASGYMSQPGTLAQDQRLRYEQIKAADEQSRAAGGPGVSVQDRVELAGYEDILAGRAPGVGGGGPGVATLDREKFMADEAERQRRYGLDVAKFGSDLASTPDTYFQARRFQGVDVPRLMGGAGAATQDAQGGPTPGVATMGAYLGGYDPYGQPQPQGAGGDIPPPGTPAYGTGPTPGAPAGAALSPQEQARYAQLIARARQLAEAGEPVPPVDADELARFQARMGPSAGAIGQPATGGAPLSAQEQARWQQLMARNDQLRAAGEPGLSGADLAEAQRYQQRGATYDPPGGYGTPRRSMVGVPTGPQNTRYVPPVGGMGAPSGDEQMAWAGGSPTFNERTGTYGGGGAAPTASVYGGPAVSASVGPQGYAQPQPASTAPSPYPSQDPRQKQVAALVKALPPSPYDGLNEQDSAALTAMQAIYKGGGQQIAGGEYERLAASGRLGFMQSAGRLLGYDPKQLESQYKAYRPTQASSRLAG